LPKAGEDSFQLIEGEVRSSAGCLFDYRLFLPAQLPATTHKTLVVIGHGFLRHQDTMTDLAKHIANGGHTATTLEFCNMRPWNGHHQKNGNDMRTLVNHLGADHIVYAGHSAGALAAVLAASADPRAVGIVTMDLVDDSDLGRTAARDLNIPMFGMAGRASSCNRMGSAIELFQNDEQRQFQSFPGASHCEFESPTDGWCETACGDDDTDSVNQSQRNAIIDGLVTQVDALLSEYTNTSVDKAFVVAIPQQQ